MSKVRDLMEEYITLRDRREERKRIYKEADAADEARQEKIEALLLKAMEVVGTDSLPIKGLATAYKTNKTSASVADREVFMQFVTEKEEWPLLEVRASKLAVEQYKDATGELPPGVNWREEIVVNVRRA